jgi:hypothetical protein
MMSNLMVPPEGCLLFGCLFLPSTVMMMRARERHRNRPLRFKLVVTQAWSLPPPPRVWVELAWPPSPVSSPMGLRYDLPSISHGHIIPFGYKRAVDQHTHHHWRYGWDSVMTVRALN